MPGILSISISAIDGPDPARDGVDVFFALLIPNAHAFAFDNDAGICRFIGFVLAQVMPDVRAVRFDNAREVVFVEIAVHGVRPFKLVKMHEIRVALSL